MDLGTPEERVIMAVQMLEVDTVAVTYPEVVEGAYVTFLKIRGASE